MLNNKILKQLFQESLELISSYQFNESVTLNFISTIGDNTENSNDKIEDFIKEIKVRHAIACSESLNPILKLIENRISNKPKFKHSDSKELNKGRLDINKYVQKRPYYGLKNSRFPIIQSISSVQTIENILVFKILKQLLDMLDNSPFNRNSAEGYKVASQSTWIRGHFKKWPWDSIVEAGNIQWLIIQTNQRLARRRTGNEIAYKKFLDWLKEWNLDPTVRYINNLNNEFVNGILSFPTDDFFWERVLEIWSLKFLSESLERLGFNKIKGPLSLNLRKNSPLYEYEKNGEKISIWFQKQIALGIPRWNYINGIVLKGIPDITLNSTLRPPLIVDAKHKLINSETNSEDTYKMLGYLDNFRNSYTSKVFNAILIISSKKFFFTELQSETSDNITLIGVVESDASRQHLNSAVDNAILKWLR